MGTSLSMYERSILKIRLYRCRQDKNKVVVVKEITDNRVTFLHAPLMNSEIHWLVPPKRETLSIEDFNKLCKPFNVDNV